MSFSSPSSEEPPLKKNKKVFQHTTISSLDSLPDDLLLSCLARVSRLYYPIISLVSKKFCSLLVSPELYESRSLLNLTESCLYVCLRFDRGFDSNPLWFTLCKKPNRNDNTTKKTRQKKKKSSGYVLATIPIPHSPEVHSRGLVTVGSNIYIIGESNHLAPPSSRVSMLDCRSHTLHEAPNMQVERRFANANVFDGKIYVVGGYYDKDSSKWMEVFDPKTKTWETVLCETVSCPYSKISEIQISKSVVIEGEVNVLFWDDRCVAYNPKEDKWEAKPPAQWGAVGGRGLEELNYKLWYSYCVIDNVLYCCDYSDGIRWYDSKVKQWVDLLSLDKLPKIYKYSRVQLGCYGGKLVVLWDRNLPCSASGGSNKKIWCAVIALEKRKNKNKNEIWGNVESIDDDVLTVPSSYEFVSALDVTV